MDFKTKNLTPNTCGLYPTLSLIIRKQGVNRKGARQQQYVQISREELDGNEKFGTSSVLVS